VFDEVRELDHGGVLLRATPTIDDLDQAALERIYPVLAPALIPRLPTVHPHEQFNRNWEPMPVLYGRDAADFGARTHPDLDSKARRARQ
jgi:hypothetical protein